VIARLVAQQYSFEPQCIVVPEKTPVTFRATSNDVVHGFIVGTTNANVMLVRASSPRSHDVPENGRAPDAVPRILRHRSTKRCGRASR
jgi:hypothetical protein